MPDPFYVCVRCGEPLGVYEPLVLELSDGTRLHGGFLTLRARLAGVEATLSHARCADADPPPGALDRDH